MIFLAQRSDPMPWWFPFFVFGMWLLINNYNSARTGWRAFSECYGGRRNRPKGPSFGSPYICFNGAWRFSYSGVVRVVPSIDGLWFYTVIYFRPFHSPFFIPWSLVTHVEPLSMWYWRGYRVHIQSEAGSLAVRLRWTFKDALLRFRPDLLQASYTPMISPSPET
ncbi:hypothetical protein SAMN02745166_05046 [Prosthecobacter debontii]|uniref:Uncharacterized protein n=1 Tax=Prosthecobacter debontii TaxID=48467 RepID=A0A1T4Z493_9BACT|nr:hypothetical protein [Prosthecobacter debontii]SKB08862.1 hypothetical protein SAMN02745166_05046 [Prosthecobacter debontii]